MDILKVREIAGKISANVQQNLTEGKSDRNVHENMSMN